MTMMNLRSEEKCKGERERERERERSCHFQEELFLSPVARDVVYAHIERIFFLRDRQIDFLLRELELISIFGTQTPPPAVFARL